MSVDCIPIYCGGDQRQKSEDFVSATIEVLQLKFIDDFFRKASLAGKLKIAESMNFSKNRAPQYIGAKKQCHWRHCKYFSADKIVLKEKII